METHISNINLAVKNDIKTKRPSVIVAAYGLAESVSVRSDEDMSMPAIVLPNGECIPIYSETDKNDMVLYHRLNEISYQEEVNKSFGSGRTYTKVSDMSLIVFGKREKVSQYAVEDIARNAITSIASRTIVRSDFNALQIFANEYAGVPFFLGSAYYLFKINYRITSTYNARCAKFE